MSFIDKVMARIRGDIAKHRPGAEDELRRKAAEYASCLEPGDTIIDETDGPVIESFRLWIPAALARRGLVVSEVAAGRYVVTRAPYQRKHPIQLYCRACGEPWFSCSHYNGDEYDLVPETYRITPYRVRCRA